MRRAANLIGVKRANAVRHKRLPANLVRVLLRWIKENPCQASADFDRNVVFIINNFGAYDLMVIDSAPHGNVVHCAWV